MSNIRDVYLFSRTLCSTEDDCYIEAQRNVRNKDLGGKMM